MAHKIEAMYVFVCTEDDGDEGVPAIQRDGIAYPLVGSDRVRIDLLREHAQEVANMTGKPVRLLKFTGKEQLEEILPKTTTDGEVH